jgi:hypothetical protein
MRATSIVKVEISPDRLARVRHAVVGAEIDLLVFDGPREALDEHIVPPRALAVHADTDLVPGQHAHEGLARELRALIRVEDLRPAVTRQRFLERRDAERRFHRDRHAPRQNTAREPLEHDRQVDEPARHWDVRDVHRPHLIGSRDLEPPQQIRMDPGPVFGRARISFRRADLGHRPSQAAEDGRHHRAADEAGWAVGRRDSKGNRVRRARHSPQLAILV